MGDNFIGANFTITTNTDSFTITGDVDHMKKVGRTGKYSEVTTENMATLTFQNGEGFANFLPLNDLKPTITLTSTVKKGDEVSNYAKVGNCYNDYSGIIVPKDGTFKCNAGEAATISDTMTWFPRRWAGMLFSNYSASTRIRNIDLNNDGYSDFSVYEH